jgi:peroxiredoxin
MSRPVLIAAVAAVLGAGVVAGVLALAGGDEPVDGEFVLDQPGVYSEPIATDVVEGESLPDATLVDADGETRKVSEFVGQPLVINLWYSTCAPCATELVDFAEVSAEHAGHIQFLGIDPVDEVEAMVAFAEARGVDYPLLRDPDQAFVSQLGTVAYPTTLFVSPQGRIVRQTNQLSADELRAEIDAAF